MGDSLFGDTSITAAKLALDGLSTRQQAISRNLANVDTPGYRAQSVDFTSALKQAVAGKKGLTLVATNPGHIAPNPSKVGFALADRPGGSSRADGNNVDVDVELTDMSEAGIEYQAVSQAISKKLALLKAIANSR